LQLRSAWQLGTGDTLEAVVWHDTAEAAPVASALDWPVTHLPSPALDSQTWWYRCRFDLPELWQDQALQLGLDGLATLAQVSLNGQPLLDSRNMFQRHVLTLPSTALPARDNTLLIRFDPLATVLAQRRPRPRWRAPMLAQQQLRWWRTSLLGRTPGWSPALPAVGPWGDVWLEPLDAQAATGLAWDSRLNLQGQGELRVAVTLPAGVSAVQVQLEGATQTWVQALSLGEDQRWSTHSVLADVQLWWPHSHGEPVLYTLHLQWLGADGAARQLPLGQTGFRRVALDTRDGGLGLVVNGQPVFARGACWTPLDLRRLGAAPAQVEQAVAQVRAAGLNMLRVSGAMVYEDEAFFEACDRHGVMVWQDLMFANMDYPADDAQFMAEVDAEMASQLPRWAGHPCLAVVCGNAEVAQQAAMWGAPRALWAPPLFHDHLACRVQQALPEVPYWPSSAWGGALPFQPGEGSSSYYGVGAYRRPLADARASGLRFATECLAFAQVPPASTLTRLRALADGQATPVHGPIWKAAVPRDGGVGWDFDEVRDHYVAQLYREPVEALRRSDPARYLLLGQAAAVEVITAAYSEWRRPGSVCRGALVWFLRDLRPGAGWGLLDDQGVPKAAFHGLASVCQPLHLGVTDEGLNGLALHLVNDGPQAAHGSLVVTAYRQGEWPVARVEREVLVPAHGGLSLAVADLLEGFSDLSWAYRFGPPPADVLVASWTAPDGTPLAQRVHFIDPPAEAVAGPVLRLSELGLQAQALALPDGRKLLSLRSRAAARCVHLVAPGWLPERDFMHLAPGELSTVHLSPLPGQPLPWSAQVGAINSLTTVAVAAAP
jgi:beta-mannosidase